MNIEILHTFDKNHYLGKCSILDLFTNIDKIENWEYNRPPDLERCKEISRAINQKKNIIDWLLHFTYCEDTQVFHVIDGIHRFYALQFSIQDPVNREWLQNQSILIIIKVNPTKGEIIDWFHAINNSNPVPELYLRDTTIEKRECVEKIVKEWQAKYSPHFMSSKKPNIGHINRDRFIDILDTLYDKYKKTHSKLVTIDIILREKLIHKNQYIKENIPKKISPKILEKCIQSGCFLFLHKIEWLCENI
jgi:hypothetical protein